MRALIRTNRESGPQRDIQVIKKINNMWYNPKTPKQLEISRELRKAKAKAKAEKEAKMKVLRKGKVKKEKMKQQKQNKTYKVKLIDLYNKNLIDIHNKVSLEYKGKTYSANFSQNPQKELVIRDELEEFK